MKLLAGYACGLLFGIGLVLGSMTDPARILAFLDVAGQWDPTLAFVMIGALGVTIPGYLWLFRSSKPWLSPIFHVPTKRVVDKHLVIGAVLFGVGWGLSGYCPGPALVSVWNGGAPGLYLVLAGMIGGWWLARQVLHEPTSETNNAGHVAP